MKIGNNIQTLLTEQGISRKELALQLHIDYSTLCGYIYNRRQPDYETLLKMSILLNTSTDFLIGRTSIRYHKDLSYNEKESTLVNNFRSLPPDMQQLLINFSHSLHNLVLKEEHFWK